MKEIIEKLRNKINCLTMNHCYVITATQTVEKHRNGYGVKIYKTVMQCKHCKKIKK
jgi:hypothetical protein